MNRTQQKILDLFNKNGGKLPSFRAIAEEVGVASTNTVSYHIDQLRKNGYLDIGRSPQGVASLSLKTIFALDAKPGVYVVLHNGKPFHIGSSTDIRKHIIETVIGIDRPLFPQVVSQPEKITIAYHIIENERERTDLKCHLSEFYQSKNIVI